MMNDANEQLLGYMYLGMGEFDHADLGAQGLTPLREGVGVRTPMPDDEPPDGVQLHDSFTADLDSFFSLSADLFHGRPQSPAPAPASGERMESPAKSFAGLRLVIEKHNVHKVEVPAEHHNGENREYTVSNLKTFKMEVALVNSSNELARDVRVALHASLLYENEQNVLRPNDGEPILIGETKVLIIGGRANFRLKVGPTVLTTKHEKQRFRVSIAPNSEHLRIQFPQLTVLSEPFKSVTKLDRKPPAASSCGALVMEKCSMSSLQNLCEGFHRSFPSFSVSSIVSRHPQSNWFNSSWRRLATNAANDDKDRAGHA